MKKILLLSAIFFCFIQIAYSELKTELWVQIRLENGKNTPWDKLYFGIAPNATDTMDKEYNEVEIPNFPFPPGVFTAVFLTYSPTENYDMWSYQSVYGPSKDSVKFYRKYRFRVFYGASNYVTMKWNKLPNYLDSAIICDPYRVYVNVNMKNVQQLTNTEPLLDVFEIHAYWNVDPNSVTEIENNEINIYPNPAKDYISFEDYDEINFVRICNFFGNELLYNNENLQKPIRISELQNGTYFVEVYKLDGQIIVKKLIINR